MGGTAVLGGIILGFGGPLAGAAFLLAIVVAYIVLRDIKIGFYGVIGVICLLPFATVPIDIGITPTFLDLALGSVIGVWLLAIVTGQQRDLITAPVALPLLQLPRELYGRHLKTLQMMEQSFQDEPVQVKAA